MDYPLAIVLSVAFVCVTAVINVCVRVIKSKKKTPRLLRSGPSSGAFASGASAARHYCARQPSKRSMSMARASLC
jgi:hypothetical protein